eukprot:9724924-Ditylum_brightwellii.AAC.1
MEAEGGAEGHREERERKGLDQSTPLIGEAEALEASPTQAPTLPAAPTAGEEGERDEIMGQGQEAAVDKTETPAQGKVQEALGNS